MNNYTEPFNDINILINEINQYTVDSFYENMYFLNYNLFVKIEDTLSEERKTELIEILIPHIDIEKNCQSVEGMNFYKLKKDCIEDLTDKIYTYSNALISIYVAENKIYDFPLI